MGSDNFAGELGVHYPLHVLNRYSVPELIELTERARSALAPFGFAQIWTNDNLDYRNPIDLAMSFATISELTPGREVSLGLGPGSRSILTHQVERVKPLGIMDELAGALRTLFSGEVLKRDTIPILASYFHLNAETYALRFKPQAPVRLYYGPSLLKPAVLDLVSRRFDGVILQTLYGTADMEDSLARMEKARSGSTLGEPLRKVMLLNASIARDGAAAKRHAKRFVSHIVSGWPDDVLKSKGI